MLNDIHVHSAGYETSDEILRDMDASDVECAAIFSPYGGPRGRDETGSDERMTIQQQRASIDYISETASQAPDRIYPFAWIEPLLPEAAQEVRRAVEDKQIRGLKMIPHHWYPYEERIFPVYEAAQELGVPILFHSGILWGFQDSSRFCRPTFFEAMLHFPKVRFALAHIGWPWTDECIATAGRFQASLRGTDGSLQVMIDTTRGTPDFYRKDALDKAFKYLGADNMVFGTDCRAGQGEKTVLEHVAKDRIILDELGISQSDQEKYFSGNFIKFFQALD